MLKKNYYINKSAVGRQFWQSHIIDKLFHSRNYLMRRQNPREGRGLARSPQLIVGRAVTAPRCHEPQPRVPPHPQHFFSHYNSSRSWTHFHNQLQWTSWVTWQIRARLRNCVNSLLFRNKLEWIYIYSYNKITLISNPWVEEKIVEIHLWRTVHAKNTSLRP